MNTLFELLAVFFGLGIGPALLGGAVWYRRQFRGVLLQWKKPGLVLVTIFAFVLNLTLFVLTCFFFAAYLGRVDDIRLVDYPAETMRQLGMNSLMALAGVTFVYSAVQVFFTQFVINEGIIFHVFDWQNFRIKQKLLRWHEIKDYYTNTDYPLTYYSFLVQGDGLRYDKVNLKVPFYALPRFEMLLEANLKRQQKIREQNRNLLRKLSKN